MKQVLFVVVFSLCAAAGVNAQQAKKSGVAVEYGHFILHAFTRPAQPAAQSVMFLGGHSEKGKKDQFGLILGNSQAPVVEFLDAANKVIRAVSANDLLGKTSGGIKSLRSSADAGGTFSETVYDVPFAQGTGELMIRSLAVPASQGSGAKLVVSFHVKGANAAAVRITMPVEGQASASENGFVVSSKTQPASFSAAVYPKPRSVVYEKNSLIVTAPVAADIANGAPVLWMIVEGSASANAAAAKSEASAALKENAQYAPEPKVIIVTAANKLTTQPADTVTYTLVCANVGLGAADGVVLNNPIPAGTSYIEESAAGTGTVITVEREKAGAPQRGAVRSVSWKLNEPLAPGAEKTVSFKVMVR